MCYLFLCYCVIVIIVHMSFAMDNFNVDKMPLEEKSFSSSSSLSDGLSFIVNDLDDRIILSIVEHVLHRQQDSQHMVFLLQLK